MREQALETIGLAPNDRRWVSNALDLAELAGTQARFDDAVRRAETALDVARRQGWRDLEARALERLGYVARQRSDLGAAQAWFEQALELFVELADVSGQARVLRGLGWVAVLAGRLDEAFAFAESARQHFEDLGDERGIAGCERTLGDVARNRGDFEQAARWFRRAGDRFEALGNIAGVSECVHGVAEVQRYQGALGEAAEGYRRSIELARVFGTRAPTIPLLNLGLVDIARERWAEARDSLEHVVSAFRRMRQIGYLGCAHTSLLPAVAGLGDWAAWDEHFALALAAFEESPLVDVDIATSAESAARIAASAGEVQRALRAWGLAYEQWTALGQTMRADVVAGALETLREQGAG
jgi:tetratricopeptide (TPR) repeat protein